MAQSVGSVSVDVVPDAGGFREKLNSKLKGLKVDVGLNADVAKLREKIEAATKNKARMTVHVDANMTKFNAKIRRALTAKNVVLNVDAKTGVAEAQLDALARDRKVELDVDVDSAAATTQLAALNGAASSSGRSMRGLIVAAIALAPALVPVTAAVGGLAAALSAPLAAAGGGLTVWGLLAGVAVKQANKNVGELEKAKTALAATKKGTEEYRDALVALKGAQKQVTPIQKRYQAAMVGITDAFAKLGKVAGASLLGPVIQGLNIAADAMLRSKPLIVAVGGALSDLLATIGKAVRGPAFKSFIEWFAEAAPPAIKAFAAIMSNIAVGVGGLIKAFAPLGRSLMKSLVGLTDRFADFGRTADSNKGVKGFMDYVREVGPLVSKFFGDFITIVVRLGEALAPIGVFILKAFGWLANALKRIPTEVLTTTAAGIIAVVVATKAMNIAMAANPIGLLIGALVALGVGLVYAYNHSEKFRKIVNKAWAGIKKAAQVTWNWMKGTLWPGLKKVFGWIGARAKWLWKNAIGPAFRAIKKFVVTELMPIIRRLWNKVIKPAFKGIGTVISDAWKHIIKPALKGIWWFIKNVLVPVIRWLWKHVIKPAFKGIGTIISVAWYRGIKPILNKLISFFEKVLFPVFRKLWHKVVKPLFTRIGDWIDSTWTDGIKPTFVKVKNWIEDLIGWAQDLIDKLNEITPGGDKGDGKGWNWWEQAKNAGKNAINPFSGLTGLLKRASGGIVHGPGTGTSDSIPARLSNGEFVVNAKSTKRHRGLLEALNSNRFAMGGYVGSSSNAGGGGGFRALWAQEIKPALNRLIAALRSGGGSNTPAPNIGGGSTGGDKNLLKGFGNTDQKKMLKGFVKGHDILQGFVKGAKKWKTTTVGMELAVGKSSKKIGKYWEHLRKGGLGKLNKAWGRSFSREMPKRLRGFDTSTGKTVNRTGKRLSGFVKGPVSRLEKSWRQTMGTDLPKSANTMDSRVRKTTGRTTKGLNAFSGVIRKDVPKAFRSGVDASAKQWDRVRKATGKPVKFVVSTVLNKGLIAAFNKIAKFVDTDPIKKLSLPKGFSSGGYTGNGGKYEPKGLVHGGEYVIRKEATSKIEKTNPGFLEHLNKTGFPGHAKGGLVNPDKRVYIDGEPIAAIAAAQLGLARQKLGRGMHLMQGGWQPATGYSGTSHQYPGVADTSPGSFRDQYWLRRVGFAAWARNIPGAHSAGSGAHVHSVSMLSPGTKASPQIAAYKAGGDGLGGSDYGDRPSWLPNLNKLLARFGPIGSLGGLGGAPALPKWAQKIANKPKKWARGLLNGGDKLKGYGFGEQAQGLLNQLIAPSAAWAVSQLQKAAGTNGAGSFGSSVKGIWKSLMSTGYFSKQQAAGVMGNMKYESGFDPHITNGIGATGLVQWYPGSKLFAYLGDKVNNVANQVDTLVKQLRGIGPYPESAAGSALKATRTPERAAAVFESMFERHGGAAQIGRQQTARAIFEQFGGGKFDSGGLAMRAGLLPKWTPQPERVLAPRQTAAFERMVARDFQPNGGGQQQLTLVTGELELTEKSKVMLRAQARAEIGTQVSHARTTGRQWR